MWSLLAGGAIFGVAFFLGKMQGYNDFLGEYNEWKANGGTDENFND